MIQEGASYFVTAATWNSTVYLARVGNFYT